MESLMRECAVDATVVSHEHVCREHCLITVELPNFPESKPGQFMQVRCATDEASFPMLRRPFSIADRRETNGVTQLSLISRAIGVGTRWLDHLRVGETLNITGPLGRGYTLPEDRTQPILLVGGGVGIPPLLYLARVLKNENYQDVTVIFGVMSHDLLPVETIAPPEGDGSPSYCLKLPGDAAFPSTVTTDDGTLGLKGRVTDAITRWHSQRGDSSAQIYACGPEPMLAAVANQSREFGFAAELCIEKLMGCGLGTCLSCIVKLPDNERPQGWRWGLSCQEGPVFDRDLLLEFKPATR